MVSVAYVVPIVGLSASELARREEVANSLTEAAVEVLTIEDGPLSIESTVEHEWSISGVCDLVAEHETAFDAFVIGCFGDPGIHAVREVTDRPVVGPGAATIHTVAQIADRFSLLTLRSTPASKRRQIHSTYLLQKLASIRCLDLGVLDVGPDSDTVVRRMIEESTTAVDVDGAEAIVPGCMSLAYMQVHDEIASELGVPFLDPLTISLETAASWARHGIRHSPVTYPRFDDERYETRAV